MDQDLQLSIVGDRLAWVTPSGRVLPWARGGESPTATADQELVELRQLIDATETEARQKKEAVDAERDRLRSEGVNLLVDARFDELDQKYAEADAKADEAVQLRGRLTKVLERMAKERGFSQPGQDRPLSRAERREFESIAKRFLGSDVYKRLVDSGALATNSHIDTDPVEVLVRGKWSEEDGFLDSPLIRALQPNARALDELRARTTVNIGDAGSVVPIDQQVWPPVVIPTRQVKLLDLISMKTTDSDMVNFVQQSVRSDFAAETPYGTNAPEADYEFVLKQASVKRIPQYIPATKDVLADQGQLQGLLQEQLMTGVRLKLETQSLTGAGASFTDTQIQGMLNASGIGAVTYQGSGHSSEYQLDAYHRAITTIRLTLFADPTGIVVHPTDYEWAVLKRDAYGRYLFDPNTESDVQSLWGLTTVVSPVISQGTGLVGDFKQAASMWIRTGLSVTASTEHLDFFTRGMVALLAEMRVAFAVQQPRALCAVNSLTGP